MEKKKVYTVIGLMSGTSLDGVDAAIIRTDGDNFIERIGSVSIPYEEELREKLRLCLGKKVDEDGFITKTEIEITRAHAGAVDWLLSKTSTLPKEVDLIGFHGQTIYHEPQNNFTWQIGRGSMLARLTGIDVINNFRKADVEAGGQGAPFLPLYHQALCADQSFPIVILNIGGVSNITYLGDKGEVIAFDTGPGNALIDDYIQRKMGRPFDKDGLIANNGNVDQAIVSGWMENEFFDEKPPKSLDRDEWEVSEVEGLNTAEGAATLTRFTVEAILRSLDHLPAKPQAWYITGGGRKNKLLMRWLDESLGKDGEKIVFPVEKLGWDGDAIEAEGFAYLAVRSKLGLPISLPSTTGVPKEMTGGDLYIANEC
jgi:anhydro-N-acetylmuramic acid kinase